MAVEAALVTPLLLMLVFGILEFSFLTRDQSSVEHAVRAGARVASTAAAAGPGTCPTGDEAPPCTPATSPAAAQLAANAIQRAALGLPEDSVDEIMVYKANSSGYPGGEGNTAMPAGCSGVSNCVTYSWDTSTNAFRYAGGGWQSTSISACFPGSSSSPLDRIGVYMSATHGMLTGLFGSERGISGRAVVDFEPLPTQTCRAGEHQ